MKLLQITPVNINGVNFDLSKSTINSDLTINKVSIYNLQNKLLVGYINNFDKVFHITGFEDLPSKD